MAVIMEPKTPLHDRVNILVTIDEKYSDRMPSLADQFRQKGMIIDDVLKLLGTITGSIDREKVASISSVEGVSHVEVGRHFQMAPPESEIQ